MKKQIGKNRKRTDVAPTLEFTDLDKEYRDLLTSRIGGIGEKTLEMAKLDQDIPEEFREPVTEEMEETRPNNVNWSEAKDRGDDLVSQRGPFIQQPERDTEIPPELNQQRAYRLYEQRGGDPGDNLAKCFEAERQTHQGIAARKKTGL